MGSARSCGTLLLGAAVGGVVILAYRVSQETGKSFSASFADVPDEAKKVFEDLRVRANEAVRVGRQVCSDRQTTMEDRIESDSQPQ
jgi:hypothetical protein